MTVILDLLLGNSAGIFLLGYDVVIEILLIVNLAYDILKGLGPN